MTASSDLPSRNPESDKFDSHYRSQLSAMMDGALSLDEARFLLRRLQHDDELNGCWERWQLCGDVLRGQARAPAPADFARRVALAIAAEPLQSAANRDPSPRRSRGGLVRWGGGALAASVALVALFMARQQGPQDNAQAELPAVATQTPTDPGRSGPVADPAPAPDAMASAATAAALVASVPRRQDNAARRSATRTQQAARSAARVAREPQQRVVAAATPSSAPVMAMPVLVAPANPFSSAPVATLPAPQARPWPRAVLQQPYSSGAGALTVGLSSDSAEQTFYPFEPRLPSSPPVTSPEPAPQN